VIRLGSKDIVERMDHQREKEHACRVSGLLEPGDGANGGPPRVHHFCIGVEHCSIDAALEKLQSDFPASKPTIYRGEELYFQVAITLVYRHQARGTRLLTRRIR